MTLTRATYGCCHAPVVGGVDAQHKCNLGRGGAVIGAGAACGNVRLQAPSPGDTHPAPSKPRAGKAAEDAMAEALAGAGYVVQTYGEWLRTATMTGAWSGDVVREFPWGLTLEPERRFRADFAFPRKGLLLEIEGGAHGVQKQRKHDVLRDQLAQQAGYKVLRVLPEQVMRDGGRAALDAVRLTLNERATAPIERDALLWVDVPEPVNGGTWWVRALRTVEEAFWPVPERLTAAEVLRALMHRPHDFLNQKNYAKVSHERLIEHLKEALALVRAAVKGGA